jgi:NAD(P)-dependent dehydrogenase (short-subunit alcohol dehydrogenase family)
MPHSTVTPSSFYKNKVVVCTGGGSGIGKALCAAFAEAGALVASVDLPGKTHQNKLGNAHLTLECNVTCPLQVQDTIHIIKEHYGKIDIYCSNAGILVPSDAVNDSCVKHSLEDWNRVLQVNVLSHVTALRCLLPDWDKGIGDGHFCVTASAAGLLTMLGDASYGVSKAAALSFCEHVAISHSPVVKVHCLCPQAVDTALVSNVDHRNKNAALTDGLLSPEQVARDTLMGIEQGDFFIFPHAEVPGYVLRKAQDHARWIKGMQRMRNKLVMKNKPSSSTSSPELRSKL